jgi:hypothetical protein
MVMSFNPIGLTRFLRNFMRATLEAERGGAIAAMAPLCHFRYKRTRNNSPIGRFFLTAGAASLSNAVKMCALTGESSVAQHLAKPPI